MYSRIWEISRSIVVTPNLWPPLNPFGWMCMSFGACLIFIKSLNEFPWLTYKKRYIKIHKEIVVRRGCIQHRGRGGFLYAWACINFHFCKDMKRYTRYTQQIQKIHFCCCCCIFFSFHFYISVQVAWVDHKILVREVCLGGHVSENNNNNNRRRTTQDCEK